MTELERARAHLRWQQSVLANWRRTQAIIPFKIDIRHHENAFRAALSWVWEEQEKECKPTAAEVYQSLLGTWTRIVTEHGL